MALSGMHTSANAADPAKLLLYDLPHLCAVYGALVAVW